MSRDYFLSLEKARILIVDDDPIFRAFAAENLARPGLDIEVAADGQEAWTRLQQGGIDLAVVDLDMPVLDGFELISLIRSAQDLRSLPVIVITSREDHEAIDRAFVGGIDGFTNKPANWHALSHQVSSVLRRTRDSNLVRAALLDLQQAKSA